MAFKPKIKKLDLYGRVPVGSSTPANGTNGDLFFNTTDSELLVYYNGTWIAIGSGTATVDGVYLTESGDYLITEASDYLAME